MADSSSEADLCSKGPIPGIADKDPLEVDLHRDDLDPERKLRMTQDGQAVQHLYVSGAFADVYVAIVRHGTTLFAIAWLPWILGTAVFGLLAFGWLDVLPVLPIWQAQIGQAPFSAMIAVGIVRFVMLGVSPSRPFYLDFGKPGIWSSVILAATALIAGGIDVVVYVEVRRFLAEVLYDYPDVARFASIWFPLATGSLRWLLATGLFAIAYLLIGANVAASAGQRGLLRLVLWHQPFRSALFVFLVYLSMIPLKIVLFSILDIAHGPLGDTAADQAVLLLLLSLLGMKFSLFETMLPALAVATLLRACSTGARCD